MTWDVLIKFQRTNIYPCFGDFQWYRPIRKRHLVFKLQSTCMNNMDHNQNCLKLNKIWRTKIKESQDWAPIEPRPDPTPWFIQVHENDRKEKDKLFKESRMVKIKRNRVQQLSSLPLSFSREFQAVRHDEKKISINQYNRKKSSSTRLFRLS